MKKLITTALATMVAFYGYSQTLQQVTDNGAVTSQTIIVNGIESTGGYTRYHMSDAMNSFVGADAAAFGQGGNDAVYYVYGNNKFHIATTGVRRLTVDGSGNVGIGTQTPKAKLDVVGQMSSYHVGIGQRDNNTSTNNFVNFSSNNHGSVIMSSNLYVSVDDNFKIANSHPSMSGAAILIPGNSRPNQGGIVFYTNSPSAVTVDGSYSGSISMLIKDNGNVGIGTATPDSKLSVNGTIHTKEVKVDMNGWSDFVFEPAYELRTLQATEQFIKANKHLPEIPSAAEVAKDGINLGEMNAKLLQKIEELTLHLIEQNKLNLQQNKRIEELENLKGSNH